MSKKKAIKALQAHFSVLKDTSLSELFSQDSQRFNRFSLQLDDLLVDFSKHPVTEETLSLLMDFARACEFTSFRDRLFQGQRVNLTEHRAAMHMALRHQGETPVMVDGKDVMPDVRQVQQQMFSFAEAIHAGQWRGASNRRITDVVSIGIGGSDLGPAMAIEALKDFALPGLKVHCVSNVDPSHLGRTLQGLNPETTLFVVISKTFTTLETMANARQAKTWLLNAGLAEKDIARHFVAVSTNTEAVRQFGIDPENMFRFWDWVGGRYSMWSAVGLPILLAVGRTHFNALLQGAAVMDLHFSQAEDEENIPLILALLDIWEHNFFGLSSHAIVPYAQPLRLFPAFLQQLIMESLGKSVTRTGLPVEMQTSPVIWGGVGTDSQHAYFQMLHQGTSKVVVDFIAPVQNVHAPGVQQDMLLANMVAQAEAFLKGKGENEVRAELSEQDMTEEEIAALLPHKIFAGNRPSTTFLFERLTPASLGRLVALYEHKTFALSVLWDINAFDQWGVELGKQLAGQILHELETGDVSSNHDSSTNGLIGYINQHKRGR
ncbi:MAG: glucose-6-phosphate isomerase [Gammaproteobacteria bacterium]|nr:MAG: glucose-6-phosphate isomerase [Gammaproteobacteria bacterium]